MSVRLSILLIVLAQQLAPPFQTPWYRRPTRVVPAPAGRQPTAPPGFRVNVFADSLQFPRFMALAPNGDVFVAEPFRGNGKITILRDADGDGVAEIRETFASGLRKAVIRPQNGADGFCLTAALGGRAI